MLYRRWLETLARFRNRTAVFDGATGQRVTFANLAERLAARPPARKPIVARSGDIGFLVEILRSWRDGVPAIPVERDAPAPDLPAPPPAGIALVKHTPGATGIPRGIHFRAEALVADAARLADAMDLSPGRPNLAVISLAQSYGFSNLVLPLLLRGVPMHALPVPFPHAVAEAFKAHDSLAVPAVPSIWRAWFRSGILDRAPVAQAFSAGAPLPLALETDVHAATGIKIRNFYGASECGGISLDSNTAPRDDPTDVGTPLEGVRTSIAPSGRLLVESDAVAEGYDEARPGDVLGGGQFLTHDIVRIEQRRILLLSTTGAAINVAGRKISPAKVETALLSTGLARRARIFGIPSADPDRVEEIVGMVALAPGATVSALKQSAVASLADWEFPRHWWSDPPAGHWSRSAKSLQSLYLAERQIKSTAP
jgi:acyl-coenzyme A synthetase/AMP-(fatty) acid ligase